MEVHMEIKLNTKTEFGYRPTLSTDSDGNIAFISDKKEKVISIMYTDDGMVVEINDDFIVD